MNNFDFTSPTKIFFGKDRDYDIGKIIKSYGFKKIAFIYGRGSIKSIGLYDKVINSLNENDIEFKMEKKIESLHLSDLHKLFIDIAN